MKIFHANDSNFKEEVQEDYTYVAWVETKDLNEAYQLTQNLDSYWTQNQGVITHRKGLRSTSIGDVIEDDKGKMHLVACIGFKKIKPSKNERLRIFHAE
jgi:hypothetical protein